MRNSIHSRTSIEINNLRNFLKKVETEMLKYEKSTLKFLFYKKLHSKTQETIGELSRIKNISIKYFAKCSDKYDWSDWAKFVHIIISKHIDELDNSIDIKLLIKENIENRFNHSVWNEDDHFITEYLNHYNL